MEKRAVFKRAVGYCDDALNLPVASVASAEPFYEKTFGFRIVERHETPLPRVIFERDAIRMGVAENGGDSSQDGCYFEVDDVDAAHAEIKAHLSTIGDVKAQDANGKPVRAFFVIAPDGLCYMIAEPVTRT